MKIIFGLILVQFTILTLVFIAHYLSHKGDKQRKQDILAQSCHRADKKNHLRNYGIADTRTKRRS